MADRTRIISGSGLFDFDIQGGSSDQSWARVGVEASHRLNDATRLTASVFGATQGEDPVLTTSLSLNYAF